MLQNNELTARQIISAALNGARVIFDIDGVLATAQHRQITKKDGSLDLVAYRENSTATKIAKDQELPIIEAAKTLDRLDIPYHIATARVFCESTKKWLTDRGVNPRSVISRKGESDNRKDHDLKRSGIIANFPRSYFGKLLLVDDNSNNIAMANDLGINTLHIDFEGH